MYLGLVEKRDEEMSSLSRNIGCHVGSKKVEGFGVLNTE
jgi:hypothetical protein